MTKKWVEGKNFYYYMHESIFAWLKFAYSVGFFEDLVLLVWLGHGLCCFLSLLSIWIFLIIRLSAESAADIGWPHPEWIFGGKNNQHCSVIPAFRIFNGPVLPFIFTNNSLVGRIVILCLHGDSISLQGWVLIMVGRYLEWCFSYGYSHSYLALSYLFAFRMWRIIKTC